MNKPKISIITSTYNSGKTLKDTIESILHQTYENVEYIIVDGPLCDLPVCNESRHINYTHDMFMCSGMPKYGIGEQKKNLTYWQMEVVVIT